MNRRLLLAMDPMCSWCWGFAPVFGTLAAEARQAGVAVTVRAGGLNPKPVLPLTHEARENIVQSWRRVQVVTGQPFGEAFGFGEHFSYDTEPACRALVAARRLDNGNLLSYIELMQQAFYVQGRDLQKPAVLLELAQEAGYGGIAFAALFDSLPVREETDDDFTWFRNLGLSGFPTLLAESDGQLALLTNGYRPYEEIAPLLHRWLQHSSHSAG